MTSKYAILILLNAPFVLYAIVKCIVYFKEGLYSRVQLGVRLLFWSASLALLLFAKPIYDFLRDKQLTDSAPLSIADVLLATACVLSFTLIVRLYARLEKTEKKLTDLNEALTLREL
jgi:hypothetical protein